MKYDVAKMMCEGTWVFVNQLIKHGRIKVEDAVRIVIEMQDARCIYEFARYIKGAPIDELARALIETKDAEHIWLFAYFVKGAPIDELAQAIIQIGDAEYIYYFAYDIKGAPIVELAQAMIKTGDAEYIYMFACDIKTTPKLIMELARGIIETQDARYIFGFACDVKRAPIDELARGIIETKNAKYIYMFACDVKGAPIEMLVNSLVELRSYYYIGLILSTIGAQESKGKRNGELQKYALEHKNRLLAVIGECTDVDILQRIKANLNDESLVAYVDGLIQKLFQAQEENNRQFLDENERENANDGVSRIRIHPQDQAKYQQ